MKIKSQILSIYFWIILVIGVCWTVFGNTNIDEYGPLFYMLSGFPVFAIFFISHFYKFGNLIEKDRPAIFKNNTMNYGVMKGDVLDMKCLFNNSKEFKSIEQKEIKGLYNLTMQSFRFMLISFALAILIGIGLTLFK